MGLLRRMLGLGPSIEPQDVTRADRRGPSLDLWEATWLQQPAITIGAPVDVVGESHHQDALEFAAGGRNALGTKRRNLTATLVREHTNEYDENAVRVDIAGRCVGYIDAADAPRFHAVIDRLEKSGSAATCRALLTGGWKRDGGDLGAIGVKLLTGRRPTKSTGRAAFLPTGPWQEHHLVKLPAGSPPPRDRSVVTLTADSGSDVAVDFQDVTIGHVVRCPDLARYVASLKAAGQPTTALARVSGEQMTIPLADNEAVAAALDKLGGNDLRSARRRLKPTGRWICRRCYRIWTSSRQPRPGWYDSKDENSGSPHICPGCWSYTATHPF